LPWHIRSEYICEYEAIYNRFHCLVGLIAEKQPKVENIMTVVL
jgi:hypothetical protein